MYQLKDMECWASQNADKMCIVSFDMLQVFLLRLSHGHIGLTVWKFINIDKQMFITVSMQDISKNINSENILITPMVHALSC